MTNQPCYRNVLRATGQAGLLLFVLQGNAAYGQDLMASTTSFTTMPDAPLVPMPTAVVSSFGRPDRLEQEVFLQSAPIQAIPAASLWVVPGAGHTPVYGEQRSQFERTARGFLDGRG